MAEEYRVLETDNLGIVLRGEFAKRLASRKLSREEYLSCRASADGVTYDRVKVDFVGDSSLLFSIGYWANSSCSIYMDTRQRDFFLKSRGSGIIPLAIGADEGGVLYVAHNADTDHIKQNLVKLWESWFENMKDF